MKQFPYKTLFQVGKWGGDPIYKTEDKGEFHDPVLMEYYAHAPYMDFFKKAYEPHIQT